MERTSLHTKWHYEIELFSQIKHSLILEGNINDSYPYPDDGCFYMVPLDIKQYLSAFYLQKGYSHVIVYNHLDGFQCFENFAGYSNSLSEFAGIVKATAKNGKISAPFVGNVDTAPIMIREALSQNSKSVVILMDMASRYIASPDHMSPDELKSLTILQQAFQNASEVRTESGNKRNLLVFLTNKQNDLPAWMYLNCPQIKGIRIDYPSAKERRQFLSGGNLVNFFDKEVYKADIPYYTNREKEWNKLIDSFVARTDGFTFSELHQLRRLCKSQKIRVKDMCSVIDLYTYGISENPWEDPALHQRLMKGIDRVKGQSDALTKTLDVIKRAVTGLSKVRNTNGMSPKGVLFFAGPTGTGKTETAKALAELVFGDETSCIRFDMSEYRQSNSDQRLLGAPPGYIGYEAGGQLTNAVRKNPFSILLFDEIEKATPSILDKFLQILDDGRLTDGQGNTVYFTDCIIIFTSNLGVYADDPEHPFGPKKQLVSPDTDNPESVRTKIIEAVQNHFKFGLGKPELLNRIGENIVVFDFIREGVAKEILDARLVRILHTIKEENGIDLDLADDAREALYTAAFDNLEFGGRGINNIIESMLINPLARHMFEETPVSGSKWIIEHIRKNVTPIDIEWRQV